jgi:hypothetical protein
MGRRFRDFLDLRDKIFLKPEYPEAVKMVVAW